MSELLKLYRNAQRPYEKLIRYCAIAPVGILPYYDGLLDQYSEADQIFVKRVLELEAKYSALTARIAELEGHIGQLFEAGNEIVVEYCGETLSDYGLQIVKNWQAANKNWKESEG